MPLRKAHNFIEGLPTIILTVRIAFVVTDVTVCGDEYANGISTCVFSQLNCRLRLTVLATYLAVYPALVAALCADVSSCEVTEASRYYLRLTALNHALCKSNAKERPFTLQNYELLTASSRRASAYASDLAPPRFHVVVMQNRRFSDCTPTSHQRSTSQCFPQGRSARDRSGKVSRNAVELSET